MFARDNKLLLSFLFVLFVALIVVAQSQPIFSETFNDDTWKTRWTITKNDKFNGDWAIEQPETAALPNDRSLIVTTPARHYAIFAPFDKTLELNGRELVVQYEVRAQNGWSCAGAYVKLVQPFTGGEFTNETPYTIMFGPDKCGGSRVHFIFRHQNPITKEWEEKHLTNPPSVPTDTKTHLYTLHVGPGTKFQVSIDNKVEREGDLLVDFSPSVNPSATIDDPTDVKPEDWIDEPLMDDPTDSKPEDWDEEAPELIPDPEAVKPEDWLDDEPFYIADPDAVKPEDWTEADGDWEAPQIWNPRCAEHGCGEWQPLDVPNPNFKGRWSPRQIPNPDYKGPWKARQIPNPNFFEDLQPNNFTPISGFGIELWSMDAGITFDNFFVSNDIESANQFAHETFEPKVALEDEVLKDNSEVIDDGFDWWEIISTSIEQNIWIVSIGLVGVAIPFFYLACLLGTSSNQENKKKKSNDKSTTDSPKSKETKPKAD